MAFVLHDDEHESGAMSLSSGLVNRRIRVAYRKTKTGSVIKMCREHYLRNDITCGFKACKACSMFEKSVLEIPGNAGSSRLEPKAHVFVLDPTVLLHKADALQESIFTNVIIAQSTFQEVKRRNPPAYKKMHDFVFNQTRNWHVFMNELHEQTSLVGTEDNSNSNALLTMINFYQQHAKAIDMDIEFVLLCDDAELMAASKKRGIQACSMLDYANSLHCVPTNLLDRAAGVSSNDNPLSVAGRVVFPEHVPLPALQQGIQDKKYKYGSFQVSRDNYLEAFVYADSADGTDNEPVFIQGMMNCNRAVHGDIVAIEMLPKHEWTCPARLLKIRDMEETNGVEQQAETSSQVGQEDGRVAQLDRGDELDQNEDAEIQQSIQRKSKSEVLPTGRVVGIIERRWRSYCGVLLASNIASTNRHLFAPAERRVPRVRIETRQADTLKGCRIIVAIDAWPRDSRYPVGHYVRSIGKLGDRKTENEVLLLEHDVPHEPFAQQVLDCLPVMPWIITDEDRQRRTDLRHLNVCSVDPPGCTDIDDALHCDLLPDGNYEVGVHIADVSHFVRPGTCIDQEAARRSTTVYLCDQRIDMLPDLLSGNLCSLRGGVERFAFSVIWTLTPDAEIINRRFHKSVISSRAALTYQAAQDRIDDPAQTDDVSKSLRGLLKLSRILRSRRKGNGALNLASMEIRFNLDSETRDPISVQEKKPLATNSMVEEFMLLANITVAEAINAEYPDCAVLRRHPVPSVANYKPVMLAAESRGFELCTDSGKALADSLDKAVINTNPYFNTMLRMLTTRCMTSAVYFAAGTLDQAQYYHFGLAAPIYTHFTSPIRRYADLMVHRLLAAKIGADETCPSMLNKPRVQEQCHNMNYRHKQAQYAGRASVLLNTHLYFKEKVEDLDGYVLSVRRNAIQVLIPKYGLESAVLVKPDSPLTFDEEKQSLTSNDGHTLNMFDRIRVQISLVSSGDGQHHRLQLRLLQPKINDFSVDPVMHAPENPTDKPE